jgi:GT2 family glycosyltransferase
MEQGIDVVINYYNPKGSERLLVQTLLSVACYQESSVPVRIFLADGSGVANERLQAKHDGQRFFYLPSIRPLTFAEGYNSGIKAASQYSDYKLIALSANDIFVAPLSLHYLQQTLESSPAVGCAIPYLSYSDFFVQSDAVYPKARQMGYMTLNLNLFRKVELVSIGMVPEFLSGYFNDIVMGMELAKQGKQIVLCHAGKVNHLHRSTTTTSTLSSYERDRGEFFARFPSYKPANDKMPLRLSLLEKQTLPRLLFQLWEQSWSNGLSGLHKRAEKAYYAIERCYLGAYTIPSTSE